MKWTMPAPSSIAAEISPDEIMFAMIRSASAAEPSEVASLMCSSESVR